MLNTIVPKLPMRNSVATKQYYTDTLHFNIMADYGDYLIIGKDNIEIHFFIFTGLDPATNYGQVYIRTCGIDDFYNALLSRQAIIHPNGSLQRKHWGQKEFSMLDPDNNLLTFGETV